MPIKPPFTYYGGKHRLAGRIAAMLPDTPIYVEPFAGSAAVLLARAPSKHEVLNDLDKEVTNFWKVLRDTPEELIELLTLTPYGRQEYLDCRPVREDVSDFERARRFFVRANMAFNASANSAVGYSSGSINRSSKPRTFHRKLERLSLIAERLRNVELENMDALKLIDRWNIEETVMYLDPPYLYSTRNSSGDYAEDNGGNEFHVMLTQKLAAFKGFAILSGYMNPLYETLGWTRVDIEVHAPSSLTGRRTECLWVSI